MKGYWGDSATDGDQVEANMFTMALGTQYNTQDNLCYILSEDDTLYGLGSVTGNVPSIGSITASTISDYFDDETFNTAISKHTWTDITGSVVQGTAIPACAFAYSYIINYSWETEEYIT